MKITTRAQRLATLRRRRDYLCTRKLEFGRSDYSFIDAELDALNWAINTLSALLELRRAREAADRLRGTPLEVATGAST